ncbi:MAG TPA: Holliday junction branch migration DNA helicase RuvB [Candidatus Gracilibacteria bacterium]|nr:Holliday junction branch migration DNA helicase RuvB [Candidatus Gracilibacteria bacterium]HRY91029.1 Holliday junction branch migration DNA helicase RuvB [Candidatus Gracilibacteria bacterium]
MIQRETEATKRLLQPGTASDESAAFEMTLRPRMLEEYIGQQEVKENLRVFIDAAKKRDEHLEHVLLHGPPGLGKTTLANIIAHEMGVNIKVTSGPALEKQGDVAAIITNLRDRDILFIDEIHRLKPAVEEVLYTAMEDFGLDLVIGKGPSARSMRLKLPKFTLIGATTKMSMLSSPLRDRFGCVFRLDFYDTESIMKIIVRSAKLLNATITEDAARRLANSCRQTPRIANRLLRRVRDFSTVKGKDVMDLEAVESALKALGVDEIGLDAHDRAILEVIINKFKGGPVGLNTVSAAVSEEENTVEDVYEPYLLKLGFLERTARGRIVTENGYKHLGIPVAK